MHFFTRVSQKIQPAAAIEELAFNLESQDLACIYFYYTEEYSAETLWRELTQTFPETSIVGCSSFKGIMTESGYFAGPVLALMGVKASSSCVFTTGFTEFSEHEKIHEKVQQSLQDALHNAQRVGEVPGLIVLHATPGHEEEIMQSIDHYFSTRIPIIGGSAADHMINGKWSVLTEKGFSGSGMAIQLAFPDKPLATGFSAGYSPTEFIGTITASKGRLLQEIDGLPAKEMYKAWISDHSAIQISDEFFFNHVTSFPLGRLAGDIDGQPYYKLIHPLRITEQGELELFADVRSGEEITLMTGSRSKLINRVVRVLKEANSKNYTGAAQLGSISIYCAGAMERLGEDIYQVQEKICRLLNHRPFICPFTFGEQGRFADGENAHGNLMISSVVFYESEFLKL
ncbi:FIST N domain protein [Vibrio aerogenes CECT 7868]|uniref:FIST N domain protein n=1 Tax=Vibrio aerogenes CECT 7868 TaxID=1216006 RepID=A0A1M5Z6N1_9VIBR|nr:FIST N-terminal domain-containing protein [Vibrio aerogenes]SHI19935.1 FIST N domain protein [Vibrio aerogenes CECT 7868]